MRSVVDCIGMTCGFHWFVLQVRPVRHLRWLPDASTGAVRPVAVPQPGGLLHLAAHRENSLHRFHGHVLLHLHGPQFSRAGISGGQGCHEVELLLSPSTQVIHELMSSSLPLLVPL